MNLDTTLTTPTTKTKTQATQKTTEKKKPGATAYLTPTPQSARAPPNPINPKKPSFLFISKTTRYIPSRPQGHDHRHHNNHHQHHPSPLQAYQTYPALPTHRPAPSIQTLLHPLSTATTTPLPCARARPGHTEPPSQGGRDVGVGENEHGNTNHFPARLPAALNDWHARKLPTRGKVSVPHTVCVSVYPTRERD